MIAVTAAAIEGDAARVEKLAARGVAWNLASTETTSLPLERAIVDGSPTSCARSSRRAPRWTTAASPATRP